MISLVHKAIFIHIPKCAGQSVEETFLQDLPGSLNWENHRHLLSCFERPPSWPKKFPDRLAHLGASEYVGLSFVSSELWDAFFKFAIVRDPLQRIVSMWKYLGVNMSLDDFIRRYLPKAIEEDHYFFRSQWRYVMQADGQKPAVDLILPMHDLSAGWQTVQARCGLKANLVHRNRTSHKPAPPVSEFARSSIRDIYSDDYEYLSEYF